MSNEQTIETADEEILRLARAAGMHAGFQVGNGLDNKTLYVVVEDTAAVEVTGEIRELIRLVKSEHAAELASLRSELEAARGKVEALTRERDDARRGREAFFNESRKTRVDLQSLTAHVKVLTASLRATGVPQALLDRMLADAAPHT